MIDFTKVFTALNMNNKFQSCLLAVLATCVVVPGIAQHNDVEALLPNATLTASHVEACRFADTLEFTLGAFSSPVGDIQDINWTIDLNGSPAAPSAYELLASTGASLNDWSTSTTLSFVPLTGGVFEISGSPITYSATQQGTQSATVAVGGNPPTPLFDPAFDDLFCEDSFLDVQTSVATPFGMDAVLHWEVTETSTGSVIDSASVASSPSAPLVIAVNIGVDNLAPSSYTLTLEATNMCGVSDTSTTFEVVGVPNFGITVPPSCEGDEVTVTSTFNLNNYPTSTGTFPVATGLWNNAAGSTTLPSAQYFPAPAGVLVDGFNVSQSIALTYEFGGDTETCDATANDVAVVHDSLDIAFEVIYPLSLPACAGEDIIVGVNNLVGATHVWETYWGHDGGLVDVKFPNELYGVNDPDIDPLTGNPTQTFALFENAEPDSIFGTVTRYMTYIDGVVCTNDTSFSIPVFANPEIAWVGSNETLACENDATTALSIEFISGNLPQNLFPLEVIWEAQNTITGDTAYFSEQVTFNQYNANAQLSISLADLPLLGNGSLTVDVFAINAEGCVSDTLTGTIQSFDVPDPYAVFEPACEGSTLIPDSVPLGGYNYEWFLNGNFESDEALPPFENFQCGDAITLAISASYLGDALVCSSNDTTFFPVILPLPDLELDYFGSLCDSSEVVLNVTNTNDYDPDQTQDCYSTSTLYQWEYSVDGIGFIPDVLSPPLLGTSITIPAQDFDTLIVVLSSVALLDSIPTLTCFADSTFHLEIFELPVIDSLLLPDGICPGSPFNVNAWGTSSNGDPLTYEWASCEGGSPTVWDPNNDPLVGDWIGEIGENVDPNNDLCLDLTITDPVGCQSSREVEVDIFQLPTVDGLLIMDAFPGDASQVICDDLGDIPGLDTPVSAYDTTDAFCPEQWFQLSPLGAVGENGTDGLTFDWTALWNNTSDISLFQDSCALGLTPADVDCLPAFSNIPGGTITVQLEVQAAGCSAEYVWMDTIHVYAPPCLDVTAEQCVCNGQGWPAEFCGPQIVQAQNPAFAWYADGPNDCVDIVLPWECITGTSTDVISGGNQYTSPSGNNALCWADTSFQLVVYSTLNPVLTCSDNSGIPLDCMVCEGGDVDFTSGLPNNPNFDFEWIKDGVVVGDEANLSLSDLTANDPCTEATQCEIVLNATRPFNGTDFTCTSTVSSFISILPNPTMDLTSEASYACDEGTIEVCAEVVCGATDIDGVPNAFTWDASPLCNALSTSNSGVCYEIVAEYGGAPGDGLDAQIKTLTVTDSYGCTSSEDFGYDVFENPLVELEGEFVCADDDLNLFASGADTYNWNVDFENPDISIVQTTLWTTYAPTGDSIQEIQFTDATLCEGVIVVEGTLVYDVGGALLECTAQDEFECVVYPVPVIDPELTEGPYCEGDEVTWTDLNTDSDPNNTLYDYQTSSDVTINDTPNNTVVFPLQVAVTTLDVTKTVTYITDGIETECATDYNTSIDVIENPVISLDHVTGICQDDSTFVNCLITNEDNAYTYIYTWEVINGGLTPDPADASPSIVVFPLNPYDPSAPLPMNVACVVRNDAGCSSEQEEIEIEVKATPILEILDGLVEEGCSPFTDCLTVGYQNEGLAPDVVVDYYWNNDDADPSSTFCANFTNNLDANPSACPLEDYINVIARFTHTLESGETLFCQSSTADTVVVNPTPEPEFTLEQPQDCLDPENGNCVPVIHPNDYVLCEGDSYTYQWAVSPLGDLIFNDLTLSELTTPNPTICYDIPGEVNVVLEITNSYGCSQTSPNVMYTVHELPVPELTFTQPTICLPTEVTVINTSSGASDYTLSIPGYPTFENFDSPMTLPVEFPGFYNADVTVSITHTIGTHEITCTVDTEYIHAFEGRFPPVANFVVLPDTCIEYVDPVAEFINLSEGQIENIWSFGNGEGSSELDPMVEYEGSGVYNAQLMVVNEYGCTDVASQAIEVKQDLYVYVPNAFSPGSASNPWDNINDFWKPRILGQNLIASYQCWIFDRSGNVVFYSEDPDYQNERWYGQNTSSGNGDHHAGGTEVFAWRIEIKKKNGQGAEVYKGHVTLIR